MLNPILVTGAAGNLGSVGREIVRLLREENFPVRALVHRLDERSDALSAMGAEVVVADMTNGADMVRAMTGCHRVYFGMSVSSAYLQATVIAAAAAKELGDIEVLVNISQMTVSQMTLTKMTESAQQQQHWMGEQVLNWSGLPVVHVRATVFLEHPFFTAMAAASIARDGTIRLPFGSAKTSPISALDVARVAATILANPETHIGNVYELTGARSQTISEMAKEYEEALGRPVRYVDIPFDTWVQDDLASLGLPEHVRAHIATMAKLHADNRYNRLTHDVEKITGKTSMTTRQYIEMHSNLFAS